MFIFVLLAIILAIMFGVSLAQPAFYYWAALAGYASLLTAHWYMFGHTFTSRRSLRALWINTALYWPMVLMLLLVQTIWLQRLWVGMIALVVPAAQLATKLSSSPRRTEGYAFEQWQSQLSVVSVFLWSVWLIAGLIILNWPLWLTAPALALGAASLLALNLRLYSVPWSRVWLASVSLAIILTEAFVVVTIWPTTMYTMAALLAVLFYLISGLIRQYILFGLAGFTRKILWRYAAISLGGMALIFATSRWA